MSSKSSELSIPFGHVCRVEVLPAVGMYMRYMELPLSEGTGVMVVAAGLAADEPEGVKVADHD